jgi:mono/diheme cytochrome c family protein
MLRKKLAAVILCLASMALAIGVASRTASASGPDSAATKSGAKEQVTFSKDVAPIFYQNCAGCHRPDELAPMSLLTYKDARPWAQSIKDKVLTREMPPWRADPHFGQFSNDKRLTQHDVDTIVAWVEQGAKEGNPKDLPEMPNFNDQWQIGKPDVVLQMAQEYTVAAEGSDEYLDFVIPTDFKEYKWVKAVEIHPGNKRVVHHVVAFVQTPQMQMAKSVESSALAKTSSSDTFIFYKEGTVTRTRANAPVYDDGCAAPNGGFARGSGQETLGPVLGFYAPGKDVDVFPDGVGKGIPPGSNIVIQMHYSKTTGKAETDRTSVGLVFYKSMPSKVLLSNGALNHYFMIPAGDGNHEVKACLQFKQDAELFNLMPHMHKRGKDMRYDLLYPDGHQETLLYVPNYNFNWQSMYKLDKPLSAPAGSKLIVTAHYDNSDKNKYNPDSTKAVRWGDPTYDEMMIGYVDYITKPRNRVVAKINPSILDAYVGEYEILPGRTMIIGRSGDNLIAGSKGFPSAPIFPESETKFFLTAIDVDITFVKNDKGEVTEIVIDQGGRTFHAKRIGDTQTKPDTGK